MQTRGPRLDPRRWIATVALLPAAAWLAALFVVPLGLIVAISLGTTDIVGQPIYGLHFGNYKDVFQPEYLPAVRRTLVNATLTTLLCVLIGYPTAYAVARYGGRRRHLLILLIALPWFVDYLIRIYAWLALLDDEGFVNGALRTLGLVSGDGIDFLGHTGTVLVGLVYSYLPFMILTVYVAVDQLDGSLLEAGKDLYAGPWATFWHVTLPSTVQGVVAGCVLVFLPSFGDFATVQFLGGANQSMIGNLIVNQFSTTGTAPLAAGLTVVIVAVLALLVLVALAVGSRGRGRGEERETAMRAALGSVG